MLSSEVISQTLPDIHGHRGARGLMPENTIPAFLKAVESGVTALEMDVVISMDGQVVVSHEPWMSEVICSHPDGRPVSKKQAKTFNFYQMKYQAIQSFDCGMRLHPEFPHQQKLNAVKPTLKMVVRSVDRFVTDNNYKKPFYNIELKTNPSLYDVYTPPPPVFVELVVNEIRRLGIENETILQSFDVNVIEELNKVADKKFTIAYIVKKGKKLNRNLAMLTFKPDVYSPHFRLIDEKTVSEIHAKGMKVIPWTINEKILMEKMMSWGVDGIITDYPDLIKY
jgi:glycerophosphoryl diester phosphodiesterase